MEQRCWDNQAASLCSQVKSEMMRPSVLHMRIRTSTFYLVYVILAVVNRTKEGII